MPTEHHTPPPFDGTLCFCNSNKAWGGGERWHLESALAMAEKGLRVFVLAHTHGALLRRARQHPEVTAIPTDHSSLSFLNPLAQLRLASFFVSRRVSRVIAGLPQDMKLAVPAAKMAGVPRVYYRRGSAVPVRGSLLNRLLYRRLAGVIVNSRETGRLLTSLCPDLVDPGKIHLLPNGLDAAAFDADFTTATPDFREGPPFDHGGPLVIGNAGRLTAQKGQKFLPHMSAALKESGFAHTVLVAGDGELREPLSRLARELGVEDTVRFTGFMPKLAPFWKSIDLFALPSLWEGFGYVLAEAMLASKPLLAFNANSMPELVRPGENGEMLPPPTAGETDAETGRRLASAVMNMAADPARMRAMGEKGRTIARTEYDQNTSMDRLLELLR